MSLKLKILINLVAEFKNMKTKQLQKVIYGLSLLFLFVYALLRAWLVSPLFDEVASFFTYFFNGNVWNEKTSIDANNHLLVSFLGHFWFKNGFDSFFYYRLISVFGFLAYVLAWHILLVKQLAVKWSRFLVVCCVAIPWIIEYGALARGYGFSIAAWMWLIVLLIYFIQQPSVWKIAAFYLVAWLGIFSSFTFTVPNFLLIGVFFVYMLSIFRQQNRKIQLSYILSTSLFVIAYLPIFELSMKLKEGGFLWWGSTKGLWEVTGSSIAELVLFDASLGIRIFINLVFFLALFTWIKKLIKTPVKDWFKHPFLWISAYTFGTVFAILVMALAFGINYPKDRVGMYLVPLFMLLLIFVLSSYQKAKWGFLIFLFFPLSLLADFNLKTTIFSPKDRITEDMFYKVKELVPEDAQFTGGWMAMNLYNYENRKHLDPRLIGYKNEFQEYSEYELLTGYKEFELPKDEYELIHEDELTKMKLYKYKKEIQKEVFDSFKFDAKELDGSNFILFSLDSTSVWTNQSFGFSMKGKVKFEEIPKNLKIHAAFVDENEDYKVLQHLNLHHVFSPEKEFEFSLVSPTFDPIKIKRLFIHLENSANEKGRIESLEVKLFNFN